jgi:hypothetical protein
MINKNASLGIALIIIGIIWTLSNLNLISDQWILPFIGIVFLIVYFYRGGIQKKGTIGFLIAGCIIFMIGIFAAMSEIFYLGVLEAPLFFFFLGSAFFPIYLIHTRHLPEEESRNYKWPLYAGFIIIIFSLLLLLIETVQIPIMQRIYSILWPIGLIILGSYIIFTKINRKQ